MEERKVDVAIIGSGTSGLNAMGRAKHAKKDFVLINGGEPGTTCARVGCMPSKVFIQVAEDFYRRNIFGRCGIEGGSELSIDVPEALEYVQDIRDTFVDRVLSNSTDHLTSDEFIEEYATFIEPNLLQVGEQKIRADKIVIATGSRPIIPEPWLAFGDRVITSDQFFEQETLPDSCAVIGLGVIGLELGQSLSRYGVDVTGIDMNDTIGGLSDPAVADEALAVIGKEFPIWLNSAAELSEAENGQITVSAGEQSVTVDKVLVTIGRTPNIDNLNIEALGITLDKRGIPPFNPNTMQIGDLPVFIAGDVNGERPILHEAGDEGKIAGHNATSDTVTAFKRKTTLGITFCDPNIVMVGQPFSSLDPETTAIGEMKMAPVGRALIMAKNRGIIRVYADKSTGKLLGAELFGAKGENLGHLLAWAIQQDMTVGQILQMPFYHPVIEEALQAALNNLYHKVEQKNDSPIAELVIKDL